MSHVCLPLAALRQCSGNRVATVCDARSRKGSELCKRVAALATGLHQCFNIRPGERVAIAALSTDLFFEVLLAVTACGAVLAPLNWRWSTKEAAVAIETCEASLLVVDEETYNFWPQLYNLCPSLKVGLFLGERVPGLENPTTSDRRVLQASEELISAHPAAELRLVHPPNGIAIICFTSGTTGHPKAVALSHAAFQCQCLAKLAVVKYDKDDVYLHTAPLFHIGGLCSALAMLMAGAVHVFLPKFSGQAALRMIGEHRATALIAVPAMLMDMRNAAHERLPSVKKLLVGGGAMQNSHKVAVTHLFPNAIVYTAYGMTEACSSITFDGPLELESNIKGPAVSAGVCVGVPAPGIEIKINTGAATPQSEGEVLTRGPHIMALYWGQPDETSATIDSEGWLWTGDIGRLDPAGRLWLMGRSKDVIKTGGENVHASEVEELIKSHPGIDSVAVVGVEDARMGELVAAVISINNGWIWHNSFGNISDKLRNVGVWVGPKQRYQQGTPTASRAMPNRTLARDPSKVLSMDIIQDFCINHGLSKFKLPRIVVAQGYPLLRTSFGKIKKQELHKKLNALLQRMKASRVSKL